MPIEFFQHDEESPSLDFLPDALEENPKLNGKCFDVYSFKLAKSKKGYMLYTSHFICWFFKKEKVLTQALEALDYYCKTGSGYQFVVQVDSKTKKLFHLGIDTEREVKYVPLENTSFVLENKSNTEVMTQKKEVNPFLKSKNQPVPSTPPIAPQKVGEPTSPTTHQGGKGQEKSK